MSEQEEFEFRARLEAEQAPRNAPNPQLAGVPGYDGAGRPQVAQAPMQQGRPINGVDVVMGGKGRAGDVFDKVMGVVEVPTSIASGMAGGLVGSLAGMGKSIVGGNFGTQKGVREGDEFGGKVAEALTYQPRTQTGQQATQKIGEAMQDSGIVGVPIPELNTLSRMAGSGTGAVRNLARVTAEAQGAQDAALVAGKITPLRDLVRKPSTLSGVGAALTPDATLRLQRAESLPVPVRLTKGMATRKFTDQQFERETAKLPEGEPLRQRFGEINAALPQNIDAFIDQAGATAPDLRSLGKMVVEAVETKKAAKKAEVNAAYKQAREAGHMADEIDAQPLMDFVEQNRSALRNAPILGSIEDEVNRLGGAAGKIPLNDLEELRKMVGRLAQPGTPNSVYGTEAIKLIDAATEGKGGPLYQQARRMYQNYANEFKNRGVIAKMLSNKPGTNDRRVAFENVLDHSILGNAVPLDDVRHVRRVLQTGGAAGEQAWRELQGGVLSRIKKTILSNSERDEMGNSVVSPAKLDRMVEGLDESGKLDFIFGKQGAQQLRDVNDLVKDTHTSPRGSVNTSNTASALAALGDLTASASAGLPLPVGTAVRLGVKKFKSNSLKKRVNDSLLPLDKLPRNQ